MASVFKEIFLVTVLIFLTEGQEDLGSDEVMIAQESHLYPTVIKPQVKVAKPTGDTNSHRPQFIQDSLEMDIINYEFESPKQKLIKNYKSSTQLRSKEGMVKEAILKTLESKDHVGKLAQMLPVIRAMTDSQKSALATLIADQVMASPANRLMSINQVRSIFRTNANTTSEQMLQILLDTVKLINLPKTDTAPQAQMLRRSDDEDTYLEDEVNDDPFEVNPIKDIPKHRTRRIPQNTQADNATLTDKTEHNTTDMLTHNTRSSAIYSSVKREGDNGTTSNPTSTSTSTNHKIRSNNISRSLPDNSSINGLDLIADATNHSLAQDLPVAEKLRTLTRYTSGDRKGIIRRGTYTVKPSPSVAIRTTAEPMLTALRRRPYPAKKLPSTLSETTKCELFTNTLCLSAEDYPTEAIIQSIRRNKAAAGALLADFKDPGDGALDGITAAEEAKYTADNHLTPNRRGDTADRDFASAGEAGFMCPSTVKYARPQRARATSGQWKYIVNTGEHTQTLRLEKCLKPRETCTYLTDNFKSKCVQVYNYHRLLTWDQQNGLHMDIFKVPTCCSCHIEGYSVSFPPLGHRIHDISSESFPGEELSAEHGNHAIEAVQTSIQRPSVKKPPFVPKIPKHTKPSESFTLFTDTQNFIAGQPFNKIIEEDISAHQSNPFESFSHTYFPDSFNQASSIKNVKRPPSRNFVNSNFDSITLPSYLEPPTPSATSTFIKDASHKFKTANTFKRVSNRNRRPIRKKISEGPDDLASSGTLAVESFTSSVIDSTEDQNDYMEEPDMGQVNVPKQRMTIAPKLHSVTTQKATTVENEDSGETLTTAKKINYNYHPIIDFFAEGEKNESIDREDSEGGYIAPLNSEWQPLNHPPSRNIQSLLRKQ